MAEELQTEEREEIGSIKFDGKAVEPGILDAGKAANALAGLNEVVRYFNSRQSPEFAKIEYEIPVRVRPGSWEAIVIAGASAFAIAYLGRAANEMAKRDFENIGFKDVFKKSMQALVHFIRLVKHTSKLKDWALENIKWRNDNNEIGIQNESGVYIFVPVKFIEWYSTLPPKMISKIVDAVEIDRELVIGTTYEGNRISEAVTIREKSIFISSEEEPYDEEFLFPELVHGDEVSLEGTLTRGNRKTNSFGLDYKGHILNCVPETGSVVQYKYALFLRCRVEGHINRLIKHQTVAEKRPTIIVRTVTPLEHDR